MARLDFGFWDSLGALEMDRASCAADVYDEHLRLAERLEEFGFHSYWVIEHQNSTVGQVTSPSVYLTAIAARTSRLRVGAMVWQLPFHNPLRLAEEVAMLDNLSHGRVEFGSGIGVHEHEFMRWGMDFYQRGPMSAEAMEIIKLAWTAPEVTYEGKYWKFDEALPAPRPYQQPHPPIWVAAHSPAAMEYAARSNYNVAQNLDIDSVTAEKFELYRNAWRACNHPGSMPRTFLQRIVHVAETDEKAHEQCRDYLMRARAARDSGGKVGNSRIGWGSDPRGMGRDGDRPHDAERTRVFREVAQSYEFSLENGIAIVGSPDTVIRRLEEGSTSVGYDLFAANFAVGAMPKELVTSSIELFGREVIPAFSQVEAPVA